jgi:radical SAM superfamily enzyme YgiQ (UPF0313 family)
MPSLYLINPASSAPGYYTAEAFFDGDRGWAKVADLTIATVAAMVPAHWRVRLVDEAIDPADLDADEDFIAITGKITQRARMLELARHFRARGQVVLIGGPFATLGADDMAAHADVLVTGEIEELAPRLFAELEAGTFAARYDAGQADIRRSPPPRWDLYPVERAMAGALQTTRGCPFNCEFCDVIQYQGRKQRHKDLDQILAELDALYAAGFRDVFLVDDNFTVHRRWARDVLEALADWNARRPQPVRFMTQASLDIARDQDLLALCRRAGLRSLFVGVETTNPESLLEAGKKQNLLMPVPEAVERIVSHGISIKAGIIVGFDHDDEGVFQALSAFFESVPVPHLGIGVLTAPVATDLYRRMVREGRLLGESLTATAQTLFDTNIQPALMSRQALLDGARALALEAYAPQRFKQRMLAFIERYPGEPRRTSAGRSEHRAGARLFATLSRVSAGDPETEAMVRQVLAAGASKPGVLPAVLESLAFYAQALHMLNHVSAGLQPGTAALPAGSADAGREARAPAT